METRNAKLLDEACNSNNEAYCDEVLYAAWADAPRLEAANDPALAPRPSVVAPLRALLDAFMARLCACQE